MPTLTRKSPVLDEFGNNFKTVLPLSQKTDVRARYDAARNDSDELALVWRNADRLSPDNANRLSVRRWLRERSRYEFVENNPYVIGVVRMVVSDFVGRNGPKLQITDKRLTPEQREVIERRHRQWTKAIKYREKLKQMRQDKIIVGETFKRSYYNPKVRCQVKLDFQIIEGDRVCTEYIAPEIMDYRGVKYVDGIDFDEYENPTRYHVLRTHPGGYQFQGTPMDGDWINAIDMRHWFGKDRDWHRGVPEMTSSLPLGVMWRRWKIATLVAAETAADFAAVMQSDLPPWTEASQFDESSMMPVYTDEDGTEYTTQPFDKFQMTKGMITTLPYGWKLDQLRSEHPGTTYREFSESLLMEIVRPILVPFNYASGSSAGSNMSSASVDVDVYSRAQWEQRASCEENVIDEDFYQWWQEGILIDGYFEGVEFGEFMDEVPEHQWLWDKVAQEHSDPLKVAKAKIELRNANILLDSDIQAEYGRSLEEWQEKAAQQAEFRREKLEGMMTAQEGLAQSQPGKQPVGKQQQSGVDPDDVNDAVDAVAASLA